VCIPTSFIRGRRIQDGIPDILSLVGAVLVCLAGVLVIRFAGKRLLPKAKLARR
jgi:drug/metabolite transporter superfamily protein YnfA